MRSIKYLAVKKSWVFGCLVLFVFGAFQSNAQIIFSDGFEDDTLNTDHWGVTWWTPHGQLDEGIEPEIVTEPVRAGNHAVMIRAQYHWGGISDYERTEITAKRFDTGSHLTFFYPGKEYWIGFSVFMPENWVPDNKSEELVFQLHGNEGSRSPSLGLYIDGKEWYWYSRWGAERNSPKIDGEKTLWRKEFEKGQWVDWVIHAKWSYSDDGYGYLEIWKNDTSVYSGSGPNCYNDDLKIRGPQTGVYKWNWGEGGDFEVSNRMVYLDEFKVGGANSDYQDVVPTGVRKVTRQKETLLIYPNPSEGSVRLKVSGIKGDYRLIVFNEQGCKVEEKYLAGYSGMAKEIILNDLKPGLYMCRITDGKGVRNYTGKFLITY